MRLFDDRNDRRAEMITILLLPASDERTVLCKKQAQSTSEYRQLPSQLQEITLETVSTTAASAGAMARQRALSGRCVSHLLFRAHHCVRPMPPLRATHDDH